MRRHFIVLMAITGGVLIGIGALLLKMFLGGPDLLMTIIAFVPGSLGFWAIQYALKHHKMHMIAALGSGTSAIVATLGGIYVLGEALTGQEMVGVVLVITGIGIAYTHGVNGD